MDGRGQIEELFGHPPYHRWIAAVDKFLRKKASSLEELKKRGLSNVDLHSIFMTGYGAQEAVLQLMRLVVAEEAIPMRTMEEVFEAQLTEDGSEMCEWIVEADDALIEEHFDESDAARLEFLADLLDAEASGPLTEEQELALEGLRDWAKKKAGAIKKKLAPGTKMVFGKVVKVGKGAVGAAKATGRAAVTAKRGVQAHTFRFTQAGKQARQAAKKIRDTKGRAAAKASYGAAKGTYKAASRAGESKAYASAQAAKAQARASKKSKSTEYGGKAPAKKQAKAAPAKAVPKGKVAPKKGAPKKGVPKKGTPKKAVSKGKGGKKRRMESMEELFNLFEVGEI